MSDSEKAHELAANDPHSVSENDVIFDCPSCHKSLVIDRIAAGHTLDCPKCGKSVMVPEAHRVVTLAEAPETEKILMKPVWEQELLSLESALREQDQQRQEAGNAYKHHYSEANRQKLRMDKLDAKIKELEAKRDAIRAQHP